MITGTVMTGLLILGGVMVFRGPVGQALARRIQGRTGDTEQALIGEIQALKDQLSIMEQHVAELEERVDFSERLLTNVTKVANTGGSN